MVRINPSFTDAAQRTFDRPLFVVCRDLRKTCVPFARKVLDGRKDARRRAGMGTDMADHTHAPADLMTDAKGRMHSLARHMSGAQPSTADRVDVDRGHDWDQASAEALMQVYEGREPTVYYTDPPPAPAVRRAPTGTGHVGSAPQRQAAKGDARIAPAAAPPTAVGLADLAQDRAWLDGRFSDLAARLEDTMKRLDPAEHIAPLAHRLDGLEGHLRSALDDVVRKDAFAGLEVQIGDVRRQLETARHKLERLDGIEAKLGALTSLAQAANDGPAAGMHAAPDYDIEAILTAAVDRTAARMARQSTPSGPALNMDELADRTATRTAERMAAAPLRAAAPEGMGELRSMVAGYVDEYRREQSQTSAALATMQEALIQLIDRIDQYDEETAADQVLAETPTSAQPQVPASSFVEVADERGSRPGRRAADLAETADKLLPNLDPAPASAALNSPTAASVAAPEPRLAMPQSAPTSDAAAPRAPRRGPAVAPPASPESDPINAAAAMAAERARMAAERASEAAPRRVGPRIPERAPETQLPEADQTDAAPVAAVPPAKARGTRKVAPASSSTAKRGLMVVGIAALLIGISAFAHMFFSDRMGAPKMEDRVPTSSGPTLSPRPQPTVSTPLPALPASPAAAAPSSPNAPAPAGDARPQPTIQRAPQSQPSPQQQPAPQAQPQPSTALPDSFKPKSIPETTTDDIQSNARPPVGSVRPSPAAMTGIAIDNGTMPNPSELAKRLSPSASGPAAALPQATAQPISTGAQPEAPLQIDAPARGPVEMPPATVGPSSLRSAAQQGDPGAQFEVAARFAEGKGLKQDFQQAIVWYTRAAQKGFVPAQYRLATLHERGLGTTTDITRAKVWYRRAADQGNVKSMHNLAVLAAGPQQAEPDYPTAARWFTEAADRGLADSQFNLGVLAENGLGVQKDQMQAYKWFALAARSGDKEAARRRDQLAATFTPDQARSAELLVTNWRSKPIEMKANDPRAAGLALAAEKDAAAQAVAQKQADQRQLQQAAPMPPPPPAAEPPKAKAAKTTRG